MRRCCSLVSIFFWLMLANPCLAIDSPEMCIQEIGYAIVESNEKKFEDLVNIDGIINDALSLFLLEVRKPKIVAELPPMLAIIFSQTAIAGSDNIKLRSFLLAESKAFVINGIASGAFAGRKPESSGVGTIAPLFADVSKGKKEIRNIGKAKRVERGWIVPFTIHDFGNGRNYHIRGLVNKYNQSFRLIAIENLSTLLSQIFMELLHSKIGD